jgi:hypothetical protein
MERREAAMERGRSKTSTPDQVRKVSESRREGYRQRWRGERRVRPLPQTRREKGVKVEGKDRGSYGERQE